MIFLRQSTASQEIPLGYFVDSTDGNTEETGLTIANTDIKLWVTGATTLASKNSGGATHIANGVYYAVLDATDTATIGPLRVFVHVSGALAVKVDCCVLDEAVYDALFGTTALATATNITAAAGITLADGAITAAKVADGAIDAGAIASDAITAAKIAAGAITSAKFAAGAIDAAAIAADAIDADAVAADAVSEIQSGLSTLTAAGVRSAVGLASANLDTQLDALPTAAEIRAEVDSNSTQLAKIGTITDLGGGATIGANLADIEGQTDDIGTAGAGLTAVPWNAAWDAEVQSEVADALDAAVPGSPTAGSINERVKTMDDADLPGRLPAALVSGRIDASVGAMAADTLTSTALAASAVTEIQSGLSTVTTAQVNAECDTALSDAGVTSARQAKLDQIPENPAKNTAFTYAIRMKDSSGDAATGLTITARRSIDGAALASMTGTVTEISAGLYKVAASAADMNGDTVAHLFTATGAQDLLMEWVTSS